MTTGEKISRLIEILRSMKKVAVAFSGGVDSAFLAAAARKALGPDGVILVTARSATSSESELADAAAVAAALGLRHFWLDSGELANGDFIANTPQRCYYCKKDRFGGLVSWASREGFEWVVEGTNADDPDDWRPGLKAIAELPAVMSPLLEAGLTKDEIRILSREWGLPTWDKPSAACLVSRLAYGLPVTAERLRQVEEAERIVRRFAGGQIRVRHHGDIARIEVSPEAFAAVIAAAPAISSGLRDLGFAFAALDLTGYRTGSMNETIDEVQNG